MRNRYFFILILLLLSFSLTAFKSDEVLVDQFIYTTPYADDLLELVIIKDKIGKLLEVQKKKGDDFYIYYKGNLEHKYNVYLSEFGYYFEYKTIDNKVYEYHIEDYEGKLGFYYHLGNNKYRYTAYPDKYNRSLLRYSDLRENVAYRMGQTYTSIELKNNELSYHYYPLKSPKFTSTIKWLNKTDFIEKPYFGLEYADYEINDELETDGELNLDSPKYQPYLKREHVETTTDDGYIRTDRVYDVGGLCYSKEVEYRSYSQYDPVERIFYSGTKDRVYRITYTLNSDNLNTENPDRIKYFDDELDPYLNDINKKGISYDKSKIEIFFYYSEYKAKKALKKIGLKY